MGAIEALVDRPQTDRQGEDARRRHLTPVLHVINGEHYAGAERVQDLLALRLPELGYEVGFACVKPGRFPELRKSTQTSLYELSMRSRFDLRAAWELARIVRREDYELLHAHSPRSLLVARPAALLAGVPLVYHVHSPTARDTTHRVRNWANAAMERIGLTGVSRLIAVSESLGRHMRAAGFAKDRVTVVHNGVPVAEEPPRRDPPRGKWTVGSVALFRPRKGLEFLLEALSLLREAGHDVELRAIGPFETPDYEREIKSQASRLGIEPHITWTGFAANVNAELDRLDLFILPSLFGEGLPMVVLEAMATGVPVVATRVEGVPEAIRDGVDGLIAEPGNARDLANKIAGLFRGEHDWSALAASALRRQAEQFSDESMARGVAGVYDAVLHAAKK
jgi:glycosyltransferase involved in cell wall biosynthesis